MAKSKGQHHGRGHSGGAFGHGGKHAVDKAHTPAFGQSDHMANDNMHINQQGTAGPIIGE